MAFRGNPPPPPPPPHPPPPPSLSCSSLVQACTLLWCLFSYAYDVIRTLESHPWHSSHSQTAGHHCKPHCRGSWFSPQPALFTILPIAGFPFSPFQLVSRSSGSVHVTLQTQRGLFSLPFSLFPIGLWIWTQSDEFRIHQGLLSEEFIFSSSCFVLA